MVRKSGNGIDFLSLKRIAERSIASIVSIGIVVSFRMELFLTALCVLCHYLIEIGEDVVFHSRRLIVFNIWGKASVLSVA